MRAGEKIMRMGVASLLGVALAAGLAAVVGLSGCGSSASTPPAARSGKLKIVTTIGMIADIAGQVGGEFVEVQGLMGPGVDPHLYKASEDDIRKLANSDCIFYGGLNLEGKMGDIFVRMARKKPAFAVTENIEQKRLREPPEFHGHYDPHVWFDVSLWMLAVERVADGLAEVEPAHAAEFHANAKRYNAELKTLHEWCKTEIATIPEKSRILVTAHDAFGYFGQAYGIEVKAIQGISTESEASLKEINELVTLIATRNVKAVFVESSVPRKNIEALVEGCKARGHAVNIGGELFSDAMGQAGTLEGTYIGMVRHNVNTIVKALK
jgi:manganese/zinc/iron transport system substrate-binding protein